MFDDTEKLKKLYEFAINELESFFSEVGLEKATDKVKIASNTIKYYIQMKQAETHTGVLAFGLAKEIAKDKDEMIKMLSRITPRLPLKEVS